jgi:hypothetical protein
MALNFHDKRKSSMPCAPQLPQLGTAMSNELSQALHTIVDREVAHILSLKLGSSPAPSAAALLGSPDTVGSLIDHTLLAPSATPSDIVATTHAAIKHKCATICVNSSYIPLVRDTLRQAGVRDYSSPKPIAVVGFPLGTATTHSKVFEAQEAIHNGAKEIDMVQHGKQAPFVPVPPNGVLLSGIQWAISKRRIMPTSIEISKLLLI